ncbi:MAG: transcriptional regulator, MarR family [Marmoricola sp.]|nr:transcriptional regulator, MarR family [Marmoricola sp.]
MMFLMNTEVRWLSTAQERVWRQWVELNARVTVTLQREMQEDSGLSMPDFEVLVNLTDSPEGRVRVTDLATQMLWERSRLSHHVTRMERRGMVERSDCAEDGRGAWIVITPAGRAAIEKAAPGHVETVRRLVFDVLTEDEAGTLGALLGKMLDPTDEQP